MKNKKGFTLIELLSVIVIIGLLMSIAIPAVSKYIDKSRRSAYINTAKEYISVAAAEIAKRTFVVRDSNTTYYIHHNNLPVEKKFNASPYGTWIDAYVVVTVDENNNYTYYWTSVDEAGYRVDLTEENDLDIDDIYVTKDLKIQNDYPLGDRCVIVIYDNDGERNTTNDCTGEDNEYVIIFDKQGGSNGTNSIKVSYGSTLPNITVPVKEGYVFDGYFSSQNGSGNQYYSSTGEGIGIWNKNEDATLYANWKQQVYTLTYDNNGGSGCLKSIANSGSAWGLLCVPTRTYYIFDGWYTKVDGGTEITSSTIATSDLTVYAHWKSPIYTLTYNNNGGSGCISQTAIAGSSWGALCVPTRDSHTFDGWYTSILAGTNITSTTIATSDQTVYAHWIINSTSCACKIGYSCVDGVCVSNSTSSCTGCCFCSSESDCPSSMPFCEKGVCSTSKDYIPC